MTLKYLNLTGLNALVSAIKTWVLSRIPTKTSELTNDASFITANSASTTYAPISHNHSASEITSGTIDIARLPPAALERLHIVADQTARYALTTNTVQEGDTVKQTDTGVMYLVVDSTKLNSADGYTEYSAGTASKAIADEDGTSIKTGYVNVAGNQTVSGQKTWSASQFYNGMMVLQASSDVVEQFRQKLPKDVSTSTDALARFNTLVDSAGHNVVITTEGHWETYVSKSVALKYKNDSTKAGTVDFRLGSNGKGILYPQNPFECSLGNATNQWSSVYAQTYYYNGTAWGLDKENVWTGANTFTAPSLKGHAGIINDSMTLGTVPASTLYNGYWFKGSTSDLIGSVDLEWASNGDASIVTRLTRNTSGASRELAYGFSLPQTGNGILRVYGDCLPGSANAYDLGTTTTKWKTLNGINPGALSLPDNSNAINLDTTNWGVSGELNHYVPTINGWLCISVKGGANNGLFLMDTSSGFGQSCYGNANETAAGRIKVALPVIASRDVLIIIHADSNSDIYEAKLYPCLGNV